MDKLREVEREIERERNREKKKERWTNQRGAEKKTKRKIDLERFREIERDGEKIDKLKEVQRNIGRKTNGEK
jgi:hypothetical protein